MTSQTTPNQRPEFNHRSVLDYHISGVPRFSFADAYYYLIAASWYKLLGLAFVGYIAINLLFATLYWLGGDNISNANPGSFWDAFFFSIQTFSTIGYGMFGPETTYAHLLVTVESFIGLVSVAMGTGLIFTKFARPSARIAYSDKMIVHSRNGLPTLQFRIANERQSELINTNVRLTVLREERTVEGQQIRRFHELKLVRDSSPVFALSWLVMHEIDTHSPLYGLTPENLSKNILLFVTSFEGTDTTLLQTVQARHLYRPKHIFFEVQFVNIIERTKEGKLYLRHENLHRIEPFRADAKLRDLD